MNTQVAALNAASQGISIAGQFEALSNQVNTYLTDYNQNTWDTEWQQLATVALNADGSPGTADGSPNTAHPINLPSGTPILVSRNNLISLIALFQLFQTFMSQASGTLAMPAQANVKTVELVTG